MTIAAGFLGTDGILLCSDSQYTSLQKEYRSKIFTYGYGGKNTRMSFALAGNENYGKMIADDCGSRVHQLQVGACSSGILTKVIRREIQRGLKTYRESGLPPEEAPQFMLALADEGGHTGLYLARDGAVHSVLGYESIGTGSYLANYVIGLYYRPDMSVEEIVIVALAALIAAKGYDPNCSGWSQFGVIQGRRCSDVIPYNLGRAEELIGGFQRKAFGLLLDTVRPSLSDGDFTQRFGEFADYLVKFRHSWRLNCPVYRELAESLTLRSTRPTSSESSHT